MNYGILHISAKKLDSSIELNVEDNGCGMSEEQIELLLAGNSDQVGYGIKNVNERLTMLFGSDYVLKIASGPGHGTKVLLPLIESEDQWRLLYESHGHR